MMNGNVLVADENFKTPCLISQTGSLDKVQKAMELLTAKGNSNIIPLLTDIFKIFWPSIMIELKKIKSTENQDEKGSGELDVAALITAFMPTIEKASNALTGMIVEGAFKFSDLAAVWLMTTLGRFRKNQIVSGISDQDYELMIDDLRRLEIIEPKLQVSLCPECLNYELTVSKYPSMKKTCPRCGNTVVVMTLFLFKDQLGKIKSKNEDLPLFISAYLKQKLSLSSFMGGNIGIYPLEQILLDDDQKSKVEIDVRIPKLKWGLECKLSEIPVAPMTEQRANSIASNLLSQMRKYVKVGITDIAVVTNLPRENLEKMNSALKTQLGNSPLPVNYVLISGNIEELTGFLNGLAERISKIISEEFTKAFEETMPIEAQPVEEGPDKEATGE
jgi:ribosomal protein S27AE